MGIGASYQRLALIASIPQKAHRLHLCPWEVGAQESHLRSDYINHPSPQNTFTHFPVSALSFTENRNQTVGGKGTVTQRSSVSRMILYRGIHSRLAFRGPRGLGPDARGSWRPRGLRVRTPAGKPLAPIPLIFNEYECQRFATTRRPEDCRATVCCMLVVARATLNVWRVTSSRKAERL